MLSMYLGKREMQLKGKHFWTLIQKEEMKKLKN